MVKLNCYREVVNTHDSSAVAVRKGALTVGHIPCVISSICSIMLFCRFAAGSTRNTMHTDVSNN